MPAETPTHNLAKDDGIAGDEVEDAIGVANILPRSKASNPKKPKDIAKRITKLLEEGKQHFADDQVLSE